MKTALILLCLLAAPLVRAGEDSLVMVPQPLQGCQVTQMPFIIGLAVPETPFTAICHPSIPPTISGGQQAKPQDIDLASRAGIRVEGSDIGDGSYEVKLDYSKVQPPYQTEELLNAVVECIHQAGEQWEKNVNITLIGLPEESPLRPMFTRAIAGREK